MPKAVAWVRFCEGLVFFQLQSFANVNCNQNLGLDARGFPHISCSAKTVSDLRIGSA